MRMRRLQSTCLTIVLLSAGAPKGVDQSSASFLSEAVQDMQAVNIRAMKDAIAFSLLKQLTIKLDLASLALCRSSELGNGHLAKCAKLV